MADGFDTYFKRGERYALLTVAPRNAPVPGQRERQLIAEWANHPRVRDFSKRLCVGSATVVSNPLARAALSVITAIWKPPSPFLAVPTVEAGLSYCLEQIHQAGLALPKPRELVRYEMLKLLEDAI